MLPPMTPIDRALVIGAGFIGTHVCAALVERGIACRVMTRWPPRRRTARPARRRGARRRRCRRPAGARGGRGGVDHVFYCAGGLMPAESNLDPAADVALALPPVLNLLETLRSRPGTALTFISSGGTVYGPPVSIPVTEDHPTDR